LLTNAVTSPNAATLASMQRAKSLQGVPGSIFTQAKVTGVSSPSLTASFDAETFDGLDFEELDSSEFPRVPQTSSFENIIAWDTKSHPQPSSGSNSFHSSPELANMPLPEQNYRTVLKVPTALAANTNPQKIPDSTPASPSKTKLSPRVASIDSLNLDSRVQASITETGVTIEEIASYISGPDPEDRKWVCLHPGCNRRFGRKENIKSHIQTQLGDRQYKCDHCDKCFVRGHDLKRHAKIHTGDKPYECLCGNVFARHDALTRHRQRGMCVGGYKGVVRKASKRGRPRKPRQDIEERQAKSFKARERVAARSIASSVTGSDFSSDSPPTEIFESMSIRGSSPCESAVMFHPDLHGMAPDVFSFTPPSSPGYGTGNKPSSPRSYRSLTPGTDDEILAKPLSILPLEKITEGFPDLPPISEEAACFEDDQAALITAATLSSPHTIPTLAGLFTESDIDMFLSQDTTSSFDKSQISCLGVPNMAGFTEFSTDSNTIGELELFQGKSMTNDDFFLQFQGDDHQTDTLLQSFPLS
jgi:regulatory protein SWI5